MAIHKNKEALKAWVGDSRAEIKTKGVMESIRDREFWNRIDDLLMIFKPIHEAQKSSEDTESTIAHVGPRWDKIEADLKGLTSTIPKLKNLMAPNRGFYKRKAVQSTVLYKVAFWLDPINIQHTLKEPDKTLITQ